MKPIIGMDKVTLAPQAYDGQRTHNSINALSTCCCWQKTTPATATCCRSPALSQLEGFYYHPRVDKQFLETHSEGIIATLGLHERRGAQHHPGAWRGNRPALLAGFGITKSFGRERFFLELQRHDIPELEQLNRQLVDLGKRYNARFVATNDVHYVDRSEAKLQDILLAIQTGALLSDPNRMRMHGDTYYFRSPEEMDALFSDVPEAITNTLEIAERCNVNLDPNGYHLPLFEVPEGYTPETYLRELCEEGLKNRYHERADDPEVRKRLEYELSVIHKNGIRCLLPDRLGFEPLRARPQHLV